VIETVEAVILSGGASRRMGADKGSLLVGGQPILNRTAGLLAEHGCPVTVLGGHPVVGYAHQADLFPDSGPLEALRGFIPQAALVLVVSCDIPLFDPRLVVALRERIGDADAAVPEVSDRLQPLCSLYTCGAFDELRTRVPLDERRVMAWIGFLRVRPVAEHELASTGIDPRCVVGVNTPEELRTLLISQ
jgi:molybdopterin-guanine dinucleotide biosynthesis protein A